MLLLNVRHPFGSKFALSGSDASTDLPLKSWAMTADGHSDLTATPAMTIRI